MCLSCWGSTFVVPCWSLEGLTFKANALDGVRKKELLVRARLNDVKLEPHYEWTEFYIHFPAEYCTSGLTNLKQLDLRNTKATRTGGAKLENFLPKCKIIRGVVNLVHNAMFVMCLFCWGYTFVVPRWRLGS